ncbi:MAG: hypothetical protein GF405_03990 [Candidatus Eisenbacteria bacterium]|nr:hypothetical protein [Candidatus Eisenbacteria bacterium]
MNVKTIRFCAVLTAVGVCAAGLAGCDVPGMGSIPGSGVSATDERVVSSFDRLSAGGFGELVIHFGEGEYVTVEGDDNIVPDVETRVRGGELTIGLARGNYDPKLPLRITVGANELLAVDVSGAVDVTAERLRGQTLDLTVSGAASASIASIDVGELVVNVSGAGDCVLSGGTVDVLRVTASGAGSLSARDVECRVAEAAASGAGDVLLHVLEDLDASASGAGSILYSGSPAVRKHTSGAGSVTSVE